jgi:hypothetical protein
MDDRPVRVDFDWGFKEGRQYGRGRSGGQARLCLLCCGSGCCLLEERCLIGAGLTHGCVGWQVRDEYRTDWDAGRGGFGNIVKQELASRQDAVKAQMGMYAAGQADEEAEDLDADAADVALA